MPCFVSRRAWLGAVLLAPALGRPAPPALRAAGELLIGGTGAGLGPLQRVAEEVGVPTLRFVPSLGTGGGLKAIAAGAIDIALAARRLTDEEKARGLVERELFRTPVVWAVHDGVPLRRATPDELADLYAARRPAWSNGAPVRLVLRPESDSDTRLARSLSPALAEAVGTAQARPGVHVATTDADATEALERIAGSLGVTTLGLVRAERRRLHVLALAGVAPGLDTLASGHYPLVKHIHLITRGAPAGTLADTVQALTGRAAARVLSTLACQTALA